MSSANVNVELERSPVGMGINKVAQWLDWSDFTDSSQNGRLTLAQTIPAGAFLLGTRIRIETALATGDTDTMDIGTSAGGTQILAGASIGSVAVVGGPAVTALQFIASATTIHVEINESTDWDNITAGKFLVEVFYLSTVTELNKGYPNRFHS